MKAGPINVLAGYDPAENYCELLGREKAPAHARRLHQHLEAMDLRELRRRAAAAERELFSLGITFTVYSDRDAIDRILPFDVIPRILSPADWRTLDTGVSQRVAALNCFLEDIYNDRKILRDGVVPEDLILGHPHYQAAMESFRPPHGAYVHICGIDIVRDDKGAFHVLEDNARTPSGVSYVIENRHLMLRAFPDLMADVPVRSIEQYGRRLRRALAEVAPQGAEDPQIVLLSPGVYNSAYFEHVFLAREMGISLVEGRDLVVNKSDKVYMKTTRGPQRVDVIYRRINDDFLDPEAFRPESMLGVPGLLRAYRKGNVTLANAVGTGVADDKAVYAYMPRIIKYYLDESPILSNVPTNICREKAGLDKTLANLDKVVTKPVGEAGGYGVVIGPRASRKLLGETRRAVLADPANYISQDMIKLSVCPTLVRNGVEPRHVDLRPFAVTGRDTWVLPGGLTRVALPRGSMVVNSSQGGGSKDTWVLD